MSRNQIHIAIKVCFVCIFLGYALLLIFSDRAKDVPLDKISTYMTTNAKFTDMEACKKTELMRFYHLQESDTEGYFFYRNPSTMSVDEILIVKCASKAKAKEVLQAMDAHLDSQKGIFDGYGTDQIGLLNNAVVETKGNYAIYMCGKDASKWRTLFLSQI